MTIKSPNQSSTAERTLKALQSIVNHDLPNMLVAIQGLMQLLEMDEEGNLSENGKDYIRRMRDMIGKAQSVTGTLRSISSVRAKMTLPETISLNNLFDEISAHLAIQTETDDLKLVTNLRVANLIVSRNLFYQVVLESLRLLTMMDNVRAKTIYASSHLVDGDTTLVLSNCRESVWTDLSRSHSAQSHSVAELDNPESNTINYDCLGTEHRLVLILLTELVTAWGGSLVVTNITNEAVCITFSIPNNLEFVSLVEQLPDD